MTHIVPSFIALSICTLVVASGAQTAPSAQFRSTALGVTIPVVVKRDRRPVTDLEMSEFVLTDSGVQQTVAVMSATTQPLDVSLIFRRTSWTGAESRNIFRDQIRDVTKLLRESDRLRLIATGEDVVELMAPSPAIFLPEILPARDQCEAASDAIAALLIEPPDPGRQHIAILMSLGQDGGDVVNTDALLEIARRSDVRLYVLVAEWDFAGTIWYSRPYSPACAHMYAHWSRERQEHLRHIAGMRAYIDQWRALWLDERQRLARLAEVTGGGEIQSSLVGTSITRVVGRVLDEARAGYILYYEPRGVPDRGWHSVAVSVRRAGSFEIHARPGYMK